MWLSVDPMWEKYAGMSPYNYCAGNPVKMVDPDGRDIVFFEENGLEIGRMVDKNQERWYVQRTTQTTDEMYAESSIHEKGNSNPISVSEATSSKYLITLVCNDNNNYLFNKNDEDVQRTIKNYFVEIPAQMQADAFLDFVDDNMNGGVIDANNMEYAGDFSPVDEKVGNKYVTTKYEITRKDKSEVGDPTVPNSRLSVGHRQNHSHSSGTKLSLSLGLCSWQQPPSATDIENSGTENRYVWGMRSRKKYIYNHSGVVGSVPFSIYKR